LSTNLAQLVKQQEHSAHKQHPVRYTNTEAYTLTHTQTLGQRKEGTVGKDKFLFLGQSPSKSFDGRAKSHLCWLGPLLCPSTSRSGHWQP